MDEFIVGMDLCPWAKPARDQGHIRIVTSLSTTPDGISADLRAEAERLAPAGVTPGPTSPATTLLVCPNVPEWFEFPPFKFFYNEELNAGFALSMEFDVFVVDFHPRYLRSDQTVEEGNEIEIPDANGQLMKATVLSTKGEGLDKTGKELARVRLEADGSEVVTQLPAEERSLTNRAPRPILHLLRLCDMENKSDKDLLPRNLEKMRKLGPGGVDEILYRCR